MLSGQLRYQDESLVATLCPSGSKYPNMGYILQTISTTSNTETIDTLYVWTSDHEGSGIGMGRELFLMVFANFQVIF